MYEGVSSSMVKVAKKLEKEIMHDASRNETTNKDEIYGQPTTYQVLHPENIIFVYETGCNTNMRQDGFCRWLNSCTTSGEVI
jgi:predicted NUDIX family phosphoesterase